MAAFNRSSTFFVASFASVISFTAASFDLADFESFSFSLVAFSRFDFNVSMDAFIDDTSLLSRETMFLAFVPSISALSFALFIVASSALSFSMFARACACSSGSIYNRLLTRFFQASKSRDK
ncbi:hypothetical protein ACHAXS_007851, partial [Conticribra weissflogii]